MCANLCERNVLQLGVLREEGDLVMGYTRPTEPEVSAETVACERRGSSFRLVSSRSQSMYVFDTAIDAVTSSNVCVQHVFERDVLQPRVLKEEGDLIVGYIGLKI
jgi:hypothetical protein